MQKVLKPILITLSFVGLIVISLTVYIYASHSHIHWLNDIDKDMFGVFGEFMGGVVGTLFGIITTILVYLTYTAQQKDVIETKKLLQKQIDLSIKPDLFFTNTSFYGFSKISDSGQAYALAFSDRKDFDQNTDSQNVSVDLVNIGIGVAKNIEYVWEFDLIEIQEYLNNNFSNNPLVMETPEKAFVSFKIEGIKDLHYLGQIYYKVKRRVDILLSHKESSTKLQLLFPLPYLTTYFIAVMLVFKNRKTDVLNDFTALDDFPKCKLRLSYEDISDKRHIKQFDFLLQGHGAFYVEPKEDGVNMFGYDLFALEV